jgi:tetratricopeptide (TPR) repeat protein
MPGRSETLSLAAAFRLLKQNRAEEAAKIAGELTGRQLASADAWHMLALCRKALGDNAGAASCFETALGRAPKDPNLLGNYASFLARTGRPSEAVALYHRLLEITPDHPDGWMNLGLALVDAGNVQKGISALERAVELRPRHSPSWQAMGYARRAAGELDAAAQALTKSVTFDPNNARAWINLGVVRRLLGAPGEALECYRAARQAGFNEPELADAEASAHLDLGNTKRAFELAGSLVHDSPGYAPGHAMLGHLLWQHGATLAPGETPGGSFEKALAAQPANTGLRREFIRFLLASASFPAALAQIRLLRAQGDSAELQGMEADALEMAGERKAASTLFAAAYPALRGNASFLNLYVRHLLRAGDPQQAAARAVEALAAEPFNQLALALLGVAWRLSGDPDEHWLCGYDRFVVRVPIEPPAAFAEQAEFLSALETALMPLHTAEREPMDQSLRGGSQTPGALFQRPEPAIAGLRDRLNEAVSRYVAALPDETNHPFLARKSLSTRFAGSWSALLRSSGRHVNHIHQQGWISSAFYVSLPPTVTAAPEGETPGCLQFGEPPAELNLPLAPRRVIRPLAGTLVLFPSYLWHGTVPFIDASPRLTVAFDVVPARS